jgi:hypothetical protein
LPDRAIVAGRGAGVKHTICRHLTDDATDARLTIQIEHFRPAVSFHEFDALFGGSYISNAYCTPQLARFLIFPHRQQFRSNWIANSLV